MASDGLGRGGWGMTLRGVPAYLIGEIPRRDDGFAEAGTARRDPDPGRAARTAALAAAYHSGVAGAGTAAGGAGRPVAFGWVRLAAGGPVRVVAAGDALVGSPGAAGSGDVLLSLPAGARARGLADGELGRLVAGIACWRMVAGISDGLLTADGQTERGGERDDRGGLILDEVLLGSWTGAFGWLVLAEPVGAGELRGLAEEVGARQRVAEASADRFPERAAQAQRLKERFAELQRGGTAGFWRVSVAAGGADEAGAARVAGLLCAAADLRGLPYALSPAPVPAGPG
ncbi:MAG TPA: hypothetical protein VGD91_11155, partial [Trebonia sp.]